MQHTGHGVPVDLRAEAALKLLLLVLIRPFLRPHLLRLAAIFQGGLVLGGESRMPGDAVDALSLLKSKTISPL